MNSPDGQNEKQLYIKDAYKHTTKKCFVLLFFKCKNLRHEHCYFKLSQYEDSWQTTKIISILIRKLYAHLLEDNQIHFG